MLKCFKRWWVEEEGVAMLEAVMLFPTMLVLMMGVYDIGNGIVLAEKTISASQIAADLVSRNRTMDSAGIEEVVSGATLAFEPFAVSSFGIDVASIRFDENKDPEVLWRETRNMGANNAAVASTSGLGEEGDGMIIVTVKFTYTPMFAKYFTTPLNFEEVAFSRGRRSPTVTWGG